MNKDVLYCAEMELAFFCKVGEYSTTAPKRPLTNTRVININFWLFRNFSFDSLHALNIENIRGEKLNICITKLRSIMSYSKLLRMCQCVRVRRSTCELTT
jgi:hypothetical protein